MPDEYTGSTFSVSNLGMFGIHEFTAIINPPEAGILAVGGIEDTPVVVDGQVVVRPRMRVTMSCDHRVIDGAPGLALPGDAEVHARGADGHRGVTALRRLRIAAQDPDVVGEAAQVVHGLLLRRGGCASQVRVEAVLPGPPHDGP